MYYVHPFIQSAALLFMAGAFYGGFKRILNRHLGIQTRFNRKMHMTLGGISIILMLAGTTGGAFITGILWQKLLVTGTHGYVGIIMIPLMLSGISSGIYIKKRVIIPHIIAVMHGGTNILVFILAIYQIWSGISVYRNFF